MRMIAGPHQRPGLDVPEAHSERFGLQFGKFPRRVKSRHGQMITGRPQILPNRQNVTVDPVLFRAVYTIAGLHNSTHHQAQMRVYDDRDGGSSLEWITDFLPDEIVDDDVQKSYDALFADLVAAVNKHKMEGS